MISPQTHRDTRAAMAWALKSGSGTGYDLVKSWKEAEGSIPITPQQLGELISLWSSAGCAMLSHELTTWRSWERPARARRRSR